MELIPKAQALQDTVHEMQQAKKEQDLAHQRELKDSINVSHLSEVRLPFNCYMNSCQCSKLKPFCACLSGTNADDTLFCAWN